ncbi:unnamed protein product [Agarophyton chilense]
MAAFASPLPLQLAHQNLPHCATCPRVVPRMGPWKKGEKDEAFRQQQEILARRRDAKQSKKYFEEVQERRDTVEEYFDNRMLKVKEGEDPIHEWRRMKENGFIDDDVGYTEEEESGIPIPMASFGIPKYDRGARFDLKLPHVEHGYADPDADIMGKAANAFKNVFGFGKKKTSDGKERKE